MVSKLELFSDLSEKTNYKLPNYMLVSNPVLTFFLTYLQCYTLFQLPVPHMLQNALNSNIIQA